MKKRFGDLLKESWKEYKANFKVIFIVFLLFFALPRLLISFIKTPASYEEFITMISATNGILALLALVIVSIICLFVKSSLIYSFVHGKHNSLKQTLEGGKKYFFKYFLFFIVHGIFILFLSLLIIPGIIFYIFWIFAAYILIEKNQGIIKSLKESYHLIRGKWWEIFGYSFLFLLTILVINIVFFASSSLINFLVSLSFLGGSFGLKQILLQTYDATFPNYISIISKLTNTFIGLGAKLITLPLGILFFKNLYFDYKKG